MSNGIVIVNVASSEFICIVVDSDIPWGKCPKGLGVITNYVLWCDEVQMSEACHKWELVTLLTDIVGYWVRQITITASITL